MIELRIDGRGESWPPRDRRLTRRVWRVYSRAAAAGELLPIRRVAHLARVSVPMARRAQHALIAYGHLRKRDRWASATTVVVPVSRVLPYRIVTVARESLPAHQQELLAKLGR